MVEKDTLRSRDTKLPVCFENISSFW